jgi:hypothetical protein
MSDELNEFNSNGEQMPPPPPTQSNRTFIAAIGVLGGIFLLILIVMAVYVAIWLPQQRAAREKQIASINAANTATSAVLTKVAISAEQTLKAPTATPLPTATNTATPKPQPTNVVAQATSTNTVAVTAVDTRTATVAALLTQAAQAKLTSTFLPSPTALGRTGFAEDVGIPGLVGVTLLLLVVIFLVRRMRTSSAS